MITRFRPTLVGLIFCLILIPGWTWAAALTWVGTGADNNFNTAANWSPAQVPTSADSCTINSTSNRQPSILGNAACGSLTLGTGATVMTLTYATTQNLTISGDVTLGANGWLAASGTPTGTFTIAGHWSDDLATTNFVNGANLQLQYAFTGTAKTISTNESFYYVHIQGTTSLASDLIVANAFTIANTKTLTQGANTLTMNGPNFNINGTWSHTCTATLVINVNFINMAGGMHMPNVIVNNGGRLEGANGSYIDCDLTVNSGGTFSIGADVYVGGNWINNGGTFLCGAGNIHFIGNGKEIRGSAPLTWFHNLTIGDGGADSLTVKTNLEVAGSLTVTAGATLTIEPGKNVNITNASTTVSGNLVLSGTTTWTQAGGNNTGIYILAGGSLNAQGINSTNRLTFTGQPASCTPTPVGTCYYDFLTDGALTMNYVYVHYTRAAAGANTGFQIRTPSATTLNFNYAELNYTEDINGAVMMRYNSPQTINATGITFNSPTYTAGNDVNVDAKQGIINFNSYGGNFAGEALDNDNGGQANWNLCAGVVTTTADSGGGSLRECINWANGNAGKDSITFDPGIFAPGTINVASVLPSLSDTLGTIINGTGATVILNGGGGNYNGLILATGSNTNEIRNLTIQNFGQSGISLQTNSDTNIIVNNTIKLNLTHGIVLNGGNDANTIQANTVESNGNAVGEYGIGLIGATANNNNTIDTNILRLNADDGLYISTGSSGSVIINNTIYSNGQTSTTGNGIELNNGDNSQIRANTVYSNASDGILLWNGSAGNTLEQNSIYSNGSATGSGENGIYLATGANDNTIIRINLVRDNQKNGIYIIGGNNTKIYHNTIYNNGTEAGAGNGDGVNVGAGVTGTIIKNNIMSSNDGWGVNSAVALTISYNDYYNNVSGGCTGSGCPGTGSINTNPLFVNAGAGNFSLTECTSPAINGATDLGADQPDLNGAGAGNYNNNAPDMGAYESSSACAPSLTIVKQAWEENGTGVLVNPVTTPVGHTLVFLIYVKNTTGGTVSDVRIDDNLNEAGFQYLSTSLIRTSAASPPSDSATDLAIFNATASGTGTPLSDAVDGDVASAVNTGGLADVDRITIGAVSGQANASLSISANSTFALRFKVKVK